MSIETITKLHPEFVTDEQGRRRVVLSVEEYEALAEIWEDYRDAMDADEARESETDFVPVEQFVDELKQEGILEK